MSNPRHSNSAIITPHMNLLHPAGHWHSGPLAATAGSLWMSNRAQRSSESPPRNVALAKPLLPGENVGSGEDLGVKVKS